MSNARPLRGRVFFINPRERSNFACYAIAMKNYAMYMRSVIFGINDSLVSTVGFLAGISVAGVPKADIVLTGIVYALVEAFSMATGDFLSEESAQEYESKSSGNQRASLFAGLFMFISCVLASLVPLVPYILFDDGTARVLSILLSVSSLFAVGVISARFSRLPMLWRGVRMAALGGAAIVMGVGVGLLMPVGG
jgi:VIT1/CCC1 family predicted Fe2+/Mn2+ transporter